MEAPVFRLEGVVKAVDDATDFEGPLTLILLLLSKDKIEIRDISISSILDQYLAYIGEMAELNLDIASDFVAMASHLAYIKTKMLLSGGEEVTELEQLISVLEQLQRGDVYAQIKIASEMLSGMYTRGGAMMPGPPEYLPADSEQKYEHVCGDLTEAIVSIIGRENILLDSRNPKQAVYPRAIVYPISDKISEIVEMLKQHGDMPAVDIFHYSKSRAEVVATLIAILELCRVGAVFLTGSEGEMMVTYTGTGREPSALEIEDGWG